MRATRPSGRPGATGSATLGGPGLIPGGPPSLPTGGDKWLHGAGQVEEMLTLCVVEAQRSDERIEHAV